MWKQKRSWQNVILMVAFTQKADVMGRHFAKGLTHTVLGAEHLGQRDVRFHVRVQDQQRIVVNRG